MADTNTYISKQKVEKWTTKEKFNELELATIETGTEYNLTGAIEESELDAALQTKINGKLTAPTTPAADSAVTMLSDGTVGTKPLTSITGKSEVYVGSTTPTNEDEILWINPDGTSSGGGSSGGGKLYRHQITSSFSDYPSAITIIIYSTSPEQINHLNENLWYDVIFQSPDGGGVGSIYFAGGNCMFSCVAGKDNSVTKVYYQQQRPLNSINDTVIEV